MNVSKTSTCSNCRTRKIRCDGISPTCSACHKSRKSLECSYTLSRPAMTDTELLRKGAACRACRRKKKKCSGDRPFCRTCASARKEDQCKYDDDSGDSVTRALLARNKELERELQSLKSTSHASPSSDSSSSLGSSSTDLGPELGLELQSFDSSHYSYAPATSPRLLSSSCIENEYDPPTGNLLFNHMNENGHQPSMNNIVPEWLAHQHYPTPTCPIPPADLSSPPDELLHLRSIFIDHGVQIGLNLTANKLDALRRGDPSGIHPAMIRIAECYGLVLYRNQSRKLFSISVDHAQHQQTLLETITGGNLRPPDAVTRVQAYCLISQYFLYQSDVYRGREFLVRATNSALLNNRSIHELLVESSGYPVRAGHTSLIASSAKDEERNALSQLVYLDQISQLMLNFPSMLQNSQLLEDFSIFHQTTTTSDSNVIFWRVKSLMYLMKARKILSQYRDCTLGPPCPPGWREDYWKIVEEVHEHLGCLSPIVVRLSTVPDHHSVVLGLKVCTILSLTALCELHGTVAPHHAESSRKHSDVVVEMVSISSSFSEEDCEYLDPVLSTCWTTVMRALVPGERQPSIVGRGLAGDVQPMISVIRRCVEALRKTLPFVLPV